MAKLTLEGIRNSIRKNYLPDEKKTVERLISQADLSLDVRRNISAKAANLVRSVRGAGNPQLMEAFLSEYGLSTGEGVALMCLAEALLRVPDADTMDDLIRDKIMPHDWSAHSGESSSIFVNASTWALVLTGRVLEEGEGGIERTLRSMIRRLGEPVIRKAVSAAMREMGEQFVLGRTIEEALKRGRDYSKRGYTYSFDMLGEAARTEADALRYHKAYADAISALKSGSKSSDIAENHGISVKLSAIHPRYEVAQKEAMLPVMKERLLALAVAARDARMGLNIDAEEADRLDLSLDVIEDVLSQPELAGWDGFGVVVQAYGQRAAYVIDWLYALSERLDRKIMVRLVKGAYWDTEVKRAQVLGLSGYPVFTRKQNTDISYISCARKLLGMTDRIYPQFATHNAHTVATILELSKEGQRFEFQRLHGMGEALHETVRNTENTKCRIYAPVGAHSDLLAYLVRRLLENGANSSFVHQIVDKTVSAEQIATDPFEVVAGFQSSSNPAIPKPVEIFGSQRLNAKGWDINDFNTFNHIKEQRERFSAPYKWTAGALGSARSIHNPALNNDVVGTVHEGDAKLVQEAVTLAANVQNAWEKVPVAERVSILLKAADLYEDNAAEFFALCAREAGKTLADSVAELREAVDFLRYYANEAPKAEMNTNARGVIAAISPWNFPLAIFTGQIAAALVTGNTVVAKPAEQTPLIASRAVQLLHQAGIPEHALQVVFGDGLAVGTPLTADPRIAGVCFTGSTEVARLIERQLAQTAAPDAMLIAETGGMNAMVVDSTALPEQAVRDIVASAFQSAGQRCSALRILYVQKDIEAKILEMLTGAMTELSLGNPWNISSDIGPVIDEDAQSSLAAYCNDMKQRGRLISSLDAPIDGHFIAPHLIRVDGISEMQREMFGPLLHVATFESDEIDNVISDINSKGYGLTFGLHTRIDARVQHFVDRMNVGNIYINRNQIGAVVGSQPFGGEGLSGAGPKAGGPHYLARFRKGASDKKNVAAANAAHPMVKDVDGFFPDATSNGWATRSDRIAVLRKYLRGKGTLAISSAAALEYGPVDLPGPTGEANNLFLAPRGKTLCLGSSDDVLFHQTIQSLVAGNSTVAVSPTARKILLPLLGKGLPLEAIDGVLDPSSLINARDLTVVSMVAGDEELRDIRQALAKREGPIVRLITSEIEPVAYASERAVCVDTTAAGGNASLLAAVE